MKQRLVSAAIGILLLIILLFFYNTWIFNLVIGLLAALGIHELMLAAKYTQRKLLTALSLTIGFLVPICIGWNFEFIKMLILFYVMLLFALYIGQHEHIRFETMCSACFFTMVISFSMSTFIVMRDATVDAPYLYVILGLGSAWIPDAGAYFTGRFFGKHPMAPRISPKKTVEGLIGGLLSGIIFYFAYSYGYAAVLGWEISFNNGNLLILGIVTSVAGVIGDLVASLIKRQCGIKDFGTIIPGHGGILDRFDSVLFAYPTFVILLHYLPIY